MFRRNEVLAQSGQLTLQNPTKKKNRKTRAKTSENKTHHKEDRNQTKILLQLHLQIHRLQSNLRKKS